MQIVSLGLNHTTAPLHVRERAAVAADSLDEALEDLQRIQDVDEAAILSTCNRTEIYCQVSADGAREIGNWLCDYHQLEKNEVWPYLYMHPDEGAVKHAFRVASGLDSMVLGEPEILGQMKTAFATAHKNGHTGKVLNRLFQHTFSVAKQIRTTTSIGENAVSVAYAGVSLAKQIFSNISEQTVLLVGAGETIESTCRHLYSHGAAKIIIANRTIERAESFADEFGAEVITLHELPSRLPDADIVVSSTASTLPILGKGGFERALRQRKNRPMLVIDLAVPRDVEPEVGELRNIYLYTVDDLHDVVNENLETRRQAAKEAEKIIHQQSQAFMNWFDNLQTIPTIKDLRQQTNEISDRELNAAQKRLAAGDDPSEVLQHFAHSLSQKFMHNPTETLRLINDQKLLKLARALFSLDQDK